MGIKERKKNRRSLIAMSAVILVLTTMSLTAEQLCHHDAYFVDAGQALLKPCSEYWFGTDALGRCVACRLLTGMKYSLFSALAIVFITGTVGILLGVIGAYFGKTVDKALLYLNVVFQSFPGFVLAIFIAGILGNGLINGVIALCITGWARYARLARSLTLEIINADYLKSAKLSGLKTAAVVKQHIIPNIAMPLVVTMALSISDAVIGISGLSFLGIGAKPPMPEWGTMMSEARTYLQIAPWTIIAPGAALFALVIVFNMFANALQNVVDPRRAKLSIWKKKQAIRRKSLEPISK